LPGLDQHVHFALLLTLLTGLSTGIGSLLGLLNRSFNPRLLALSLSFSAGVMIQVSFLEIFPKARTTLSAALGVRAGYVWTTIAFFAGIALMAAIDQVLPSHGDAAQLGLRPSQSANTEEKNALLRMGLFSALAIAIHNFPEGLATFMAAVISPSALRHRQPRPGLLALLRFGSSRAARCSARLRPTEVCSHTPGDGCGVRRCGRSDGLHLPR
jgi:ZIP family zinc transporter